MSKAYSGIPIDERRTWVVPRWLKEAFVAFAAVAVLTVGVSKAVQHFGGATERAKSALLADELDAVSPPLKLPSRLGGEVDLSRYRGKAVLLHFWATWCAPCRDELPLVEKLTQRYDPSTFEVLAVSVDTSWDLVDRFLPASPLHVLLDPGGKLSTTYGTTKFPESYLVDRDGRLRLKFVGPRNWLDPNVSTLLASYGVKPKA